MAEHYRQSRKLTKVGRQQGMNAADHFAQSQHFLGREHAKGNLRFGLGRQASYAAASLSAHGATGMRGMFSSVKPSGGKSVGGSGGLGKKKRDSHGRFA